MRIVSITLQLAVVGLLSVAATLPSPVMAANAGDGCRRTEDVGIHDLFLGRPQG